MTDEANVLKPLVYLESSVISYLCARPSRDVIVAGRQAASHEWWDNHRTRFRLCVSALVEHEVGRGDAIAAALRLARLVHIPRLVITDEALALAKALVAEGAVPIGSEEDALHIGIAAAQGLTIS